MSDEELMYALQCCSPQSKYERTCYGCPLMSNNKCHTELIEAMMNYIIRTKAQSEHVNSDLKRLSDIVDSLRTM